MTARIEVDYSSSIWISRQEVKKSEFLFWWNFDFFCQYFVFLVHISWRSSLLAILSSHFKIERSSFECCKTKTKAITLTNHNSRK